MGFSNAFVSKPCRISVKHNQLHMENEDGDNVFVLSDMNSLLVESAQCTVTTGALQRLTENGVAVFFCNDKHLPSAVLLSYNDYFRQLKTYKLQTECPKPVVKQLWQSIVKRKIENQAEVLKKLKLPGGEKLLGYAAEVRSDDAGNIEASAAAEYFKNYLGADDTRQTDNCLNSCLNYTYAIMRGIIARSLAVYGFLPFLGLHHRSELNGFNLADDLIEPFRAFADLWVAKSVPADAIELTPDIKRKLYSIVNVNVKINESEYALSYAVELVVQSLRKCLTDRIADISLPTFSSNFTTHLYA